MARFSPSHLIVMKIIARKHLFSSTMKFSYEQHLISDSKSMHKTVQLSMEINLLISCRKSGSTAKPFGRSLTVLKYVCWHNLANEVAFISTFQQSIFSELATTNWPPCISVSENVLHKVNKMSLAHVILLPGRRTRDIPRKSGRETK